MSKKVMSFYSAFWWHSISLPSLKSTCCLKFGTYMNTIVIITSIMYVLFNNKIQRERLLKKDEVDNEDEGKLTKKG